MSLDNNSSLPVHRYSAAGGVVVFENKVLVLERPGRQEIRLPKGHVKDGEKLTDAAIREVSEESGYSELRIVENLGVQKIEFDYDGVHIIREEVYFLMALKDEAKTPGEVEFTLKWLSWENALEQLTYPAEKEWLRRAMKVLQA